VFFDASPIAQRPLLLATLIGAVLLLDHLRIDVFERGHVSPAAVPTLALASLFGPLGPLASESVIALVRVVQRKPLGRSLADLGVLSLAGAAAAGVFALLPGQPWGALTAAGAVAGLAYYVVNVVLLGALMALGQGVPALEVWRRNHRWLAPHYLAFGALGAALVVAERSMGAAAAGLLVVPMLVLWLAEKQYLDRSRSGEAALRASHAELSAANVQLRELLGVKQELLARVHRSYLSTITSLARTIEAKDPYTGGHTERVADIACRLAEELGFDEEGVRSVNVGAVIHDIGKIGVPDRVLLKPGALNPDELRDIRQHPEISSYILADLDLPAMVKQMVRSHHERYDGTGYPDGLAGEQIPLAARLLSVADALDAMTSDRPYRRAVSLADAIGDIRERAGTQFCPAAVAALERCLGDLPDEPVVHLALMAHG
jgi:putative nucleotidyltransferase with HDIG domain